MSPNVSLVKKILIEATDRWLHESGIGDTDRPDKVLYHYTGAVGLKGILTDKMIWATHLDYLNDISEGQYGRKLACEVIKSKLKEVVPAEAVKLSNLRGPNSIPGLPNLGIYAHLPRENWAKAFIPLSVYMRLQEDVGEHFFVTSLCEEGDLLSQWRGYANAGGGYSIGLQVTNNAFKNAIGEFQLYKILYDQDQQVRLIDRILDEAISLVTKLLDSGSGGVDDEAARLSSWDYISSVVADCLSVVGMRFKDGGFQEEKEWRFSAKLLPKGRPTISPFKGRFPTREELEGVKFRPANGLLIPYLEFPIEGDDLKVSSIRCGPNLHPMRTELSLRMLAVMNGFEDVAVEFSKIPFKG